VVALRRSAFSVLITPSWWKQCVCGRRGTTYADRVRKGDGADGATLHTQHTQLWPVLALYVLAHLSESARRLIARGVSSMIRTTRSIVYALHNCHSFFILSGHSSCTLFARADSMSRILRAKKSEAQAKCGCILRQQCTWRD
jgi:hypothetical protein